MNGTGVYILFYSALFYFLVFLFDGKSLKWYHILHTIIVMMIIFNLLWYDWYHIISIEHGGNKVNYFLTILMVIGLLIIFTQKNRKPYTEILKKEIWGEWAEYEK